MWCALGMGMGGFRSSRGYDIYMWCVHVTSMLTLMLMLTLVWRGCRRRCGESKEVYESEIEGFVGVRGCIMYGTSAERKRNKTCETYKAKRRARSNSNSEGH